LLQSTIGVVGLCGGGSHVAQQLAHLGVGELVLIDDQEVELTNLTRMVLARTQDVGKPKAEVIASAVAAINPGLRVTSVPRTFPSSEGITALKRCDAVVCCVDSYSARSELMTFAWRHLIPLIDIGMAAIPSKAGSSGATQVLGHCCVYHPGGPCMWCADQLSQAKLDAERGAADEGRYVRGMAAPQVVSTNGLLASLAVTELMQYLTGFMPESLSPTSNGFILWDGVARTVEALAPSRKATCRLCQFELGAGDPAW